MRTVTIDRMARRWAVLAVAAGLAATGLVVAMSQQVGTRTMAPPSGASEPVYDDASAARAAKRTGHRVEVPNRATERMFVYANPDGTYTSETHTDAVRVRRGNGWVPVDTTLVRYSDGRIGPRAAQTPMSFSAGGTAPLAIATQVSRTVSMSWPGRLPVPALDGSTATYSGVLPGVDLTITAGVNGFSHLLVVKSREAMANPALREIAYSLRGQGLRIAADPGGRITAVDAVSRAELFDAAPPVMWDANGRTAKLGVRVRGDRLLLTPDRALLSDPSLAYPVTIDPYLNSALNASYTMVDSAWKGNSYYLWQNAGNSVSQRIGRCPDDVNNGNNCQGSLIKRLYYELPTPYQDATMSILDARFNVTLTHLENSWKVADVLLYRAAGDFNSGTTWNSQPGEGPLQERRTVNNSTFATAACTTTGGTNISFNATEAATWAHNAGRGSVPFLLRADDEDDRRQSKRFCHDAVLAVTYNRPPYVPASPSMSSGGLCTAGVIADAAELPTLTAQLNDPDTGDAEPMKGRFTVNWTLANGTPQMKTWETSVPIANGQTASYNLADPVVGISTIPENGVATWKVQAADLDGNGGVVSWGSPTADCQFKLNTQAPVFGPHIESQQYMPDTVGRSDPKCGDPNVFRDGVGNSGTFLFKANPADTDIKKYYYGLGTNPSPSNVLTPAADSGSVTLAWLPDREGDYVISVQSVDSLGRPGPVTACHILVGPGRGPVNEWTMADPAGASGAADGKRGFTAVAGNPAKVVFGQPGRVAAGPSSVRLNGDPASYLATAQTAVINTAGAYSISVWVKLDDLTSTQTVVSQDGTGEVGFALGFDKPSGRWMFWTSNTDGVSMGRWMAVSNNPAQAGRWTHLLAGYNPVAKQLTLQVDVDTASTGAHRSVMASYGAIQIGRRGQKTGYVEPLRGQIADLRLFDRIVPPTEGVRIAARRVAYWRLNDYVDPNAMPKTTPEQEGTRVLVLGTGASVYHYVEPDPDAPPPDTWPDPALVGDGHLVLTGAGDARTTSPVAGVTGSYSVSVRVRPAAVCVAGHNQAVLSQPGANASRFILRCAVTGNGPRWQLVLVNNDATNAGQKVITDDTRAPSPTQSQGQLLTFTVNQFTGEVRFYVDGVLAESAKNQTFSSAWTGTADGGLRIGSAIADGTGAASDPFSGLVDEVRVYSGVLDPSIVQLLNASQEQLGL